MGSVAALSDSVKTVENDFKEPCVGSGPQMMTVINDADFIAMGCVNLHCHLKGKAGRRDALQAGPWWVTKT